MVVGASGCSGDGQSVATAEGTGGETSTQVVSVTAEPATEVVSVTPAKQTSTLVLPPETETSTVVLPPTTTTVTQTNGTAAKTVATTANATETLSNTGVTATNKTTATETTKATTTTNPSKNKIDATSDDYVAVCDFWMKAKQVVSDSGELPYYLIYSKDGKVLVHDVVDAKMQFIGDDNDYLQCWGFAVSPVKYEGISGYYLSDNNAICDGTQHCGQDIDVSERTQLTKSPTIVADPIRVGTGTASEEPTSKDTASEQDARDLEFCGVVGCPCNGKTYHIPQGFDPWDPDTYGPLASTGFWQCYGGE